MNIDPTLKHFTDTYPIGELNKEMEDKFKKWVDEGKIVARGSKEELKLLQDDLRKAGYRKFNKGPLK